MKEEAKKQLKPISIYLVKKTLKKIAPEVFDKMIISENQQVKRCNFIYAKLKYQKVEKVVEKIKFPLYDSLIDSFSKIEGGSSKHGEKAKMPSEDIFEELEKSYSKVGQAIIMDSKSSVELPLDVKKSEILLTQSKHFYPDLTFKEVCDQCYGHKYVNCTDPECNGRHIWTCTNCKGKGILVCETCEGHKNVDCPSCNGTTRVTCKKCGGDGKVNDGYLAKTIFSKSLKEKKCGECAGKGHVECNDCKSGKVVCNDCHGIGKVICPECFSEGIITCFYCYGDKERLGKVNCPQCQTVGVTAQIVYDKFDVSFHELGKFILDGESLSISERQVKSHLIHNQDMEIIYENVNGKVKENYNEFTKQYSSNIEKDLGLYKGGFPMITKEELYYQIVACVELSYKHILTNTVHEFTIIDFWNNPEIIYHSEPEQLKNDTNNATKELGGFFGKLFKTKSYKTKNDLRNELVLQIYLIKADGIITDKEKLSLSEIIIGLNKFTNTEKQRLFDLMNAAALPELSKADVTFSSPAREQEVLNKLRKLASADGEMIDGKEKSLIENVEKMMSEAKAVKTGKDRK